MSAITCGAALPGIRPLTDPSDSTQSPKAASEFKLSDIHPNATMGATPAERNVVLQHTHIGPLPPAIEFERYRQVDPGAPGIILAMAQGQQRHDHFMEKGVLLSETLYRVLGLLAAVAVVGGMVGGAVYCAGTGHESAAVALGGGAGVACLAGVFVRGRNLTGIQADAAGRRSSVEDGRPLN